jgi:hypothetical protein
MWHYIKRTPLMVASVLLLSLYVPVAEAGSCAAPSKVAFKTTTETVQTTSPTFVDVPNGSVSFTGSSNCAFVRFSAVVVPNEEAEVQVLLDGSVIARPGPVPFIVYNPYVSQPPEPISFDFVLTKIPLGSHVIQLQWRITSGAKPIEFRARTLLVSY